MLKRNVGVLTTSAVIFTLACVMLQFIIVNAQASATEHVYYGYVPPSTDVYNPNVETEAATVEMPEEEAGRVDELIKGTLVDYLVPSGMTLLDIVGLEDGTSVEIWDIYTNERIESLTLDKFEKRHFFMPVGTFFKIISTEKIGALLSGGESLFEPDGREEPPGGTSTFYPAVTGGFRGKEFIFAAAPATHPFGYSADRIGYNFYLMALQESDWALSDSEDAWSQSGHLGQRGIKTLLLQSRVFHQAYSESHGGGGNDVVFYLSTTDDVEVSSCAGLSDLVAVPAVTGGYVGELFYAPLAVTFEEEGRTAVFIVVPLEEGEVTIYDLGMNEIASRSFTASDVENMNHWYHQLGIGRYNLIAESTGDIAFMVGQTEQMADIDFLGDDITFIGSRPNQEIRFYVPTMAVIFAPETMMITIDGAAPTQMAKDAFGLLESGVHSVSADKHVVVEIMGAGAGWNSWGSYLIEPADVDVSFEAPEDFLSKAVDYTMYIAVAGVAVVLVILVVFILRRRRVG